jgi:hypothetical protein
MKFRQNQQWVIRFSGIYLLLFFSYSSFLSLNGQSNSIKPFFLNTRPGDPPDSIFRSLFVGKHAKYFQEWKSQEENQKYQNYRFRKVRYLAYKNQIHSIIVRMDYTDFNKGFLDLLVAKLGEATKPDSYRPIYFWKTQDSFLSYEEDIVGDLIEVRVVSLAVQKQFEEENPEAIE